MQICVFSDTHNNYPAVCDVVLPHSNADLFVFCGDGQYDIEKFLTEHPEFADRFVRVRGNCDFDTSIPLMATVPLPYGHKLIAVHGHYYESIDFYDRLAALGKENGADIVVFGHLHVRFSRSVNGVRLFSPGSAAKPRDDKPASFGLIDIFERGVLVSHGDLPRSSYGMSLW